LQILGDWLNAVCGKKRAIGQILDSCISPCSRCIQRGDVHLEANSLVAATYEGPAMNRAAEVSSFSGANVAERRESFQNTKITSQILPFLVERHLSPWSSSRAKRLFDCACVLPVLLLLLPIFLMLALAVRMTSHGPALFRQKRMGLHGHPFTILKFRTLLLASDTAHSAVTTAGNQRFTPIGPFLRRYKLDELPQLLNVLRGEMSLVGPRPKMPEHVIYDLLCRPGITGAATIAFAGEEAVLDRVPRHQLQSYYHSVVLPAKRKLDAEYMARATFLSDLRLIVNSVLRRWDGSFMEALFHKAFNQGEREPICMVPEIGTALPWSRKPPSMERPVSAEQGAGMM
jgi:lipopolysaccharide/colanic/teichoic acid biosynthesis glycosyltransferase